MIKQPLTIKNFTMNKNIILGAFIIATSILVILTVTISAEMPRETSNPLPTTLP